MTRQNCLIHSLLFWKEYKDYRIYHDGNHVAALPPGDYGKMIPIETEGIDVIKRTFSDVLDGEATQLLDEYFKNLSLINEGNKC